MADGATQYAYGSSVQVFTSNGLVLASVIGPKPNGRMFVTLRDEKRNITVMPSGNGWIEVRQLQPA